MTETQHNIVKLPSPGDLPNPGIKPTSPALQANSLPAEPQGKPKSTGVGSLSLPQWIFPTQESNWGLLHCRRILYQLSHQGSLVPYQYIRMAQIFVYCFCFLHFTDLFVLSFFKWCLVLSIII